MGAIKLTININIFKKYFDLSTNNKIQFIIEHFLLKNRKL